jgi:hypothetical protein
VRNHSLRFHLNLLVGQSSVFNLLQGGIHFFFVCLVEFLQEVDAEVHVSEVFVEEVAIVELRVDVFENLGNG